LAHLSGGDVAVVAATPALPIVASCRADAHGAGAIATARRVMRVLAGMDQLGV